MENTKKGQESPWSDCSAFWLSVLELYTGVLVKRFGIIYRPCRMWHKEEMTTAGNACVIIHNMIVSQRRDKYKGTQNIRLPEDDTRMPREFRLVHMPHTCYKQAKFWRAHVDG
jgi:Plant transposon protein